MKKRLTLLILCALIALQFPTAAGFGAESGKDLFADPGDWAVQNNAGSVKFNDKNELEIIGVETDAFGGTNAAVYKPETFGSGKLSFDFQINFADGVSMEDYQAGSKWLVSCFFGVMFLQNVETDTPDEHLGIPWDIPGGYPYMLCFDTEVSGNEPNRAKQLGLTLRRYEYSGSHNYTRWSTVEPTDETFSNSLGESYQSKIPDFYKPVTTDMVWDGDKHSVSLEWKSLRKADGAERDAVEIRAWYDGEHVLTVYDDMPIKGEYLGEEVDVDKRAMDGYLAVYTYHDSSSASLENYGYQLVLSNMSIVPGPSNGGGSDEPVGPDDPGDGKGGCGSCGILGDGRGLGGGMGAVLLLLTAAGLILLKKRERDGR